jgi:hypothetical protein
MIVVCNQEPQAGEDCMKYRELTAFLGIALLLSLAACATAPKGMEDSVHIVIVPKEELKAKFGSNFRTNPFLAPSTVMMGEPVEFVVLRVEVNASRKADLLVNASINGAEGQEMAKASSLNEMTEFWRMWQDDDVTMDKRQSTLESCYLRDAHIAVKPGRDAYYLVLMGKKPIPRPSAVIAGYKLGDAEAVGLKIALDTVPAQGK